MFSIEFKITIHIYVRLTTDPSKNGGADPVVVLDTWTSYFGVLTDRRPAFCQIRRHFLIVFSRNW